MSRQPNVRFRRVAPTGWRGDGFGRASASYEAIVDGEVVGSWSNEGTIRTIYGQPTIGCFQYRRWRLLVIDTVNARPQQEEEPTVVDTINSTSDRSGPGPTEIHLEVTYGFDPATNTDLAWLAEQFVAYLADQDSPVAHTWGPPAREDSGYEGPFIRYAIVHAEAGSAGTRDSGIVDWPDTQPKLEPEPDPARRADIGEPAHATELPPIDSYTINDACDAVDVLLDAIVDADRPPSRHVPDSDRRVLEAAAKVLGRWHAELNDQEATR